MGPATSPLLSYVNYKPITFNHSSGFQVAKIEQKYSHISDEEYQILRQIFETELGFEVWTLRSEVRKPI